MVTSASDDQQHIQGLLGDGTLIPMNFTVIDGKPMVSALIPTPTESQEIDDVYETFTPIFTG